jgi:hypothetical protein
MVEVYPTDRTDRPFLNRFPSDQRSSVSNVFLESIRKYGAADSQAVVETVTSLAHERLAAAERWQLADAIGRFETLIAMLAQHPDEARIEAARAVWYENLPSTERLALKRRNAEHGRQSWMSGQAPTPKQINYLRTLGHSGEPPRDRLAASRLIDQLVSLRCPA